MSFLWLINGGDPNYLRYLGWSSKWRLTYGYPKWWALEWYLGWSSKWSGFWEGTAIARDEWHTHLGATAGGGGGRRNYSAASKEPVPFPSQLILGIIGWSRLEKVETTESGGNISSKEYRCMSWTSPKEAFPKFIVAHHPKKITTG